MSGIEHVSVWEYFNDLVHDIKKTENVDYFYNHPNYGAWLTALAQLNIEHGAPLNPPEPRKTIWYAEKLVAHGVSFEQIDAVFKLIFSK